MALAQRPARPANATLQRNTNDASLTYLMSLMLSVATPLALLLDAERDYPPTHYSEREGIYVVLIDAYLKLLTNPKI